MSPPGRATALRPAVFAAVAGVLLLATAGTSITLTYLRQSRWREIKRIPYISDAHYDEIQSPIFVAMSSVTTLISLLAVILTFFVAHDRLHPGALSSSPSRPLSPSTQKNKPPLWRQSRHLDSPSSTSDFTSVITSSTDPTSTDRSSLSPLSSVEIDQSLLPHSASTLVTPHVRRNVVLNYIAVFVGILSCIFLLLVAAVSTKLKLHRIVASLSLVSTTLWAILVNLSLPPASTHTAPFRVFVVITMWMCSLTMIACSITIAVVAGKNSTTVVLMEYIIIVAIATFFFSLSQRLSSSRLSFTCHTG